MTPTPAASKEPQTARSAETRARLVAIAERLFAERGIEGVSLNDINKAAGQRNKNCTHYHFGSKTGLLQAIFDKHEPGIAARRNQLLDEFEARGKLTLHELVQAMIVPLTEKLHDADGGREFLRFNAHFVITHTTAALKAQGSTFNISRVDRLTDALRRTMPQLPEPVAYQRGILVAVMLMHGFAEHCRVLQSLPQQDAATVTRYFRANMEDCLLAVLRAPASAPHALQAPHAPQAPPSGQDS